MGSAISPESRAAVLDSLGREHVDLLVVGGGITGAGIARDAALRGLGVLLVEAVDFAAGTSSRSSKLIHGGVRYLEQGDVGLVREAANERTILRRIAPHLATRLTMVIPTHRRSALMKLRAGLWAFEKLAPVADEDRHQVWSPADTVRREPSIRETGLAGAVSFTEYLTDDARLVMATVRAAAESGAAVANHLEVLAIDRDRVRLRDTLGDREIEARARVVVNAAGPWVTRLQRLAGVAAGRPLQLTKGIHIVVPWDRLPLRNAVVLPARDHRSVFAVPRNGITYLGTTDTLYPAPELSPRVEAEEVDYLLDAARRAFAVEPLTGGDITSAWSGLRPLLMEPGKAPSEISRRDEIMVDGETGLISIAGGKLTTYRKMAERVVDLVVSTLGRPASPCRTAEVPLPAGAAPHPGPADLVRLVPGLSEAAAGRLIRLYGTESMAMTRRVAEIGADRGFAPLLQAEVEHAIDCEMALTLEDILERRTRSLLFEHDQGLGDVEAVAALAAERLGWDGGRTATEIAAYRDLAARLRSFA